MAAGPTWPPTGTSSRASKRQESAVTTAVMNSSAEMWPSPMARRLTATRSSPGASPDWSGWGMTLGLQSAAPSRTYSQVKAAPSTSCRASDSSTSGGAVTAAFALSSPGRSGWCALKPSRTVGQQLLDLGVVEGEDPTDQVLGAMHVRRLDTGQEQPSDHPLEIGDEVLVWMVRDGCGHSSAPAVRAWMRVLSAAMVDSAPRLKLRPSACSPS